MAFTLTVNPGSASKKYSLIQDGALVRSYQFERVPHGYELCVATDGAQQKCETTTADEYTSALRYVLDGLLRDQTISSLTAITAVGVRIVAPGSFFQSHRIVDVAYLNALRGKAPAAPLHVPFMVRELELLLAELPEAVIVGVSDSAFHQTLPPVVRNYPIVPADTEQHDIHRFGYHGLSCASIVRQLPNLFSVLPARAIVCHIGSGMSMTALRDGVSIDTSMGFGPGGGLMMGGRTGDIDTGAVLELMRAKSWSHFDIQTYLQTQGGFKGLVGEGDFRFLLERLATEDYAVKAAFDTCIYQFQKTLGAQMAALGGLDAIIFTATAAERSPVLRALLLRDLDWLGITLDAKENERYMSSQGIISSPTSKVTVAVMRTDEWGEILRQTEQIVRPR
jgi:acetate kinase